MKKERKLPLILVADDDPTVLALSATTLQVAGFDSISFPDGSAMLEEFDHIDPDLVLLDIEMPEASGLDAVRELDADRQPVFIFVTAYDQYATEAFEVEALDYVLKPVSEERLGEALGRAKKRVRERRLSQVAEQVATLTAGLGSAPGADADGADSADFLSRLPISSDGRTRFIEADEIVWIESQDYYVQIHTKHGHPLVRATLKSLASRLDPRRFCQIRRGALVNVGAVDEIQKLFKGAHALVLSDGTELRVSRARWQEVRERLAPRLRRG